MGAAQFSIRSKSPVLNFLIFVYVRVDGGCWEWLGAVNDDGYGIVRFNKRMYKTHRLLWELVYNRAPKYLMHRCDNRVCVNPDHLRESTHAENMRDMAAKGRWDIGTRQRKEGRDVGNRATDKLIKTGCDGKSVQIAKQTGAGR